MIYVIKSLFNSDVTSSLYNGFLRAINESEYDQDIKLIDVPGAFDIPGAVSRILGHDDCKIVITLGCVIKGETPHFNFICSAFNNALMQLSIDNKKPMGNGVITCLNLKQAEARTKKRERSCKSY